MKRLETVIKEALGKVDRDAEFNVIVFKFIRFNGSWDLNDACIIASRIGLAEVLTLARERWPVFKANYCPKAKVKDLENIGDDEHICLEVNHLSFIEIQKIKQL